MSCCNPLRLIPCHGAVFCAEATGPYLQRPGGKMQALLPFDHLFWEPAP
jgi:hypothetical protein